MKEEWDLVGILHFCVKILWKPFLSEMREKGYCCSLKDRKKVKGGGEEMKVRYKFLLSSKAI